MRGRRASRALRRRPEAMFFAPFSRRAPTARVRQVAMARGALSVRHRARGQVEDGGRRVPHSSQPDHLLPAGTPSPAAHPVRERRPHLHLPLQPRRGSSPGAVGRPPPTVRGDAGHRGATDMRQEPSARAPFTAHGHETDARRLCRSPGHRTRVSSQDLWKARRPKWPVGRRGCAGAGAGRMPAGRGPRRRRW